VITAVDSNVLLDVFLGDARYLDPSRRALRTCLAEGALVACEIVWIEVASLFPDPEEGVAAMEGIGIGFDGVRRQTAIEASRCWRNYRRRGGRRDRVVADFVIGAHASAQADRLLTRDRGFYRHYFGDLSVLDPGSLEGRS
jgi:hypothetical protein